MHPTNFLEVQADSRRDSAESTSTESVSLSVLTPRTPFTPLTFSNVVPNEERAPPQPPQPQPQPRSKSGVLSGAVSKLRFSHHFQLGCAVRATRAFHEMCDKLEVEIPSCFLESEPWPEEYGGTVTLMVDPVRPRGERAMSRFMVERIVGRGGDKGSLQPYSRVQDQWVHDTCVQHDLLSIETLTRMQLECGTMEEAVQYLPPPRPYYVPKGLKYATRQAPPLPRGRMLLVFQVGYLVAATLRLSLSDERAEEVRNMHAEFDLFRRYLLGRDFLLEQYAGYAEKVGHNAARAHKRQHRGGAGGGAGRGMAGAALFASKMRDVARLVRASHAAATAAGDSDGASLLSGSCSLLGDRKSPEGKSEGGAGGPGSGAASPRGLSKREARRAQSAFLESKRRKVCGLLKKRAPRGGVAMTPLGLRGYDAAPPVVLDPPAWLLPTPTSAPPPQRQQKQKPARALLLLQPPQQERVTGISGVDAGSPLPRTRGPATSCVDFARGGVLPVVPSAATPATAAAATTGTSELAAESRAKRRSCEAERFDIEAAFAAAASNDPIASSLAEAAAEAAAAAAEARHQDLCEAARGIWVALPDADVPSPHASSYVASVLGPQAAPPLDGVLLRPSSPLASPFHVLAQRRLPACADAAAAAASPAPDPPGSAEASAAAAATAAALLPAQALQLLPPAAKGLLERRAAELRALTACADGGPGAGPAVELLGAAAAGGGGEGRGVRPQEQQQQQQEQPRQPRRGPRRRDAAVAWLLRAATRELGGGGGGTGAGEGCVGADPEAAAAAVAAAEAVAEARRENKRRAAAAKRQRMLLLRPTLPPEGACKKRMEQRARYIRRKTALQVPREEVSLAFA